MTSNPNRDPLKQRAHRLTRLARVQLFWERYAPVFALAGLFLGLFLIGSFAGVWERIGDPWRMIAAVVAIYFVVKAALAARAVDAPSRSEARRRVEGDSGADHRPLDVLDDTPVIGDELWERHYAAARMKAESLKRPKRRPALRPLDPYYMRFALPAALGLAMMVGAGDNIERLKRSLTPIWQPGISSADVKFEAWVDPPDYTGRPPIYFKDLTQVDIPAGSELVARISGSKTATRLKLTQNGRSRYLPLTRLGPKSFETRAIITKKSTARWRVGSLEKKWRLSAIPDRPPVVSFNINPRADKRDRLTFTYSFDDDYGVESLSLEMQRLTEDEAAAQEMETVSVPLASRSVRKAEFDKAALDMTQHRWAGEKVYGRLVARDGKGHITKSADVYFTIPDKIFVEPLAKAIVEHRALVLAGQKPYEALPRLTRREWSKRPWFDTQEPQWRMGRAAEPVQRAAHLIAAVTDQPAGLFEDPALYLGLKNVLKRLQYAKSAEALTGIPEDLWSIAIRAEFGVLGTALEEMREAQEALREGMARRAPQREIDTLFERYNEAVDNYMDELRRKALEEGNIAEGGGGGGGDSTNADEIQALMDAIEEANRIGDTEGARRALAQLAELLENMQMQLSAGGGGGEGEPMEGEMTEEMKKTLEELADLLGEQRELKDETEQNEREQADAGQPGGGDQSGAPQDGQEPGDGAMSPGELAQQQEALERMLSDLAENLPAPGEGSRGGEETDAGASGGQGEDEGQSGNDPEGSNEGELGGNPDGEEGENSIGGENTEAALEDAMRAMGESRNALGGGDFQGAGRAQSEAIDALRRAGQGLAQRIEDARSENGQQAEGGQGTDPLGRENTGDRNDDNSEAEIDQRDNATRSRELLEELRRRASEQDREKAEREYLERLLKRF